MHPRKVFQRAAIIFAGALGSAPVLAGKPVTLVSSNDSVSVNARKGGPVVNDLGTNIYSNGKNVAFSKIYICPNFPIMITTKSGVDTVSYHKSLGGGNYAYSPCTLWTSVFNPTGVGGWLGGNDQVTNLVAPGIGTGMITSNKSYTQTHYNFNPLTQYGNMYITAAGAVREQFVKMPAAAGAVRPVASYASGGALAVGLH